MTSELTPDDALFEELKDALTQADSVPDDVLAAAKESFTWRTIDAELAELVFDSAMEEVAGVRGEGAAERQLTFRAADLEIEIMVDGRQVTGQLVPPQEATVELAAGGSTQASAVDEFGAFSFDDVPAGPVRLTCRVGDTAVTTEWTVL
jgi:hypothetical protein